MNTPNALTRAHRVALAGALATLGHYATLQCLLELGSNAINANIIGTLCGATLNYLMLYYGIFRCVEAHKTVIPRYLLTVAFVLLANPLLFALFYALLGLPVWPAQLLSTALIWLINLRLYQRKVFHVQTAE